jgi:capsular polysaccharide biosynthesis protein
MKTALVAVVLVAMAVTSVSLQQAPTYEATAQVWVDQKEGDQQTYVTVSGEAIDSRPVAEDAIQHLGLRMDPSELLDSLTVEKVENTSFLRLSYTDTDPERARLIVNTVSEVSSERISPISAVASKFTATGCPLKCSVYSSRHLPSPRGLWSR